MEIILPVIFFGAIAIQLFYILFIFTKLVKHEDEVLGDYQPNVTVIVAASNELANLKELLPILDRQDYPNFEILVADDRSNDGTYDYLIENPDKINHLSYLRVKDLPDHYTAKKYAITLAVKKAKYDWLLFTDADCRPVSDQWIKTMTAQITEGKEIVLGFSKYQLKLGRLNALIRYETFQTALQYFSFALAKKPFMGVGRNLLYQRDLFWKNNGFASHNSYLSGDDDLFINAAATPSNTAICISENAYTVSAPKETWGEWFTQKKRHLSVGKKYKFSDRINLGLLWVSGMLVWLLLIPTFFVFPFWFKAPEWAQIPNEFLGQYGLAHFYPYNDWMRLITVVFIGFVLIKWWILSKVNIKLGHTLNSGNIPGYDFLYNLYLLFMGLITLFANPQKIKWK